MKNKKLTYVLTLAVIGVWGMIIYRIFAAVNGDKDPAFQNSSVIKKEAFNDYTLPKDTTRLMLNYRDPFAEQRPEEEEIPVGKLIQPISKVPVPSKPAVNWNMLKYSGFIQNPRTKKLLAIMEINGKETIMSDGETSEQVKLIKNMKDSVKITYQGTTKFITMNKSQ